MDAEKKIMEFVETKDGKLRLSCGKAHDIAKEYEVELSKIAKICEDKNIRIYSCELGCF